MKLAVRSLLLCILSLATTLAFAVNPPPHFEHIVIIVQENRTPDNLFGNGHSLVKCNNENPFEAGVDIVDGGPDATQTQNNGIRCLAPLDLATCVNPDHSHGGFKTMLDLNQNGVPQMDGACKNYQGCGSACPMYSYVIQADVQPYYDIATNYGFANYFFQTSQGPSFPAHQFLLSGTSAPDVVSSGDSWWQWFDAENMYGTGNVQIDAGCVANSSRQAEGINPSNGNETLTWYPPPLFMNPGFPCYSHRTMIDLFEGVHPNITWKYYAPLEKSIWTAPTAIYGLCGGIAPQTHCPNFAVGGKYASNMRMEGTGTDLAPIYTDITNCSLAQVSWVIPDKKWSDHPGSGDNIGKGPSYVANIVNLIGQSTCTDANTGNRYWKDTAVLIVWDDWGGWYDHVPPFKFTGYDPPNTTNGKQYVYGFRVPFLVVSPYTPDHHVSGAIMGTPSYPPPAQYTHDFGSILKFIEQNWGLGEINPNTQPEWDYADHFAMDNNPPAYYSLGDFFQGSYRDFTGIPIDPRYGPSYFSNYPGVPEAPVDDTDD
jgi:hypothetical protein